MPHVRLNGTRLWYDERGVGPAVVLVHAGIVDARMWDEHVDALAERHRVVRYDQRGFGHSARPEAAYSEVEDLRALLDELGIEEAVLVGVSKGGSIAINFTLTYPERVSALVPVASGLGGFRFNPYSAEQEAAWEAAYDAKDWLRTGDVDLEVWAPLGSEGRIGELVRANAAVAEVEHLAQPLERPAVDRLAEIRVPTMVVTGDRDVDGMTDIGDKLEAEIRGARRVVIEGADHLVPMRKPDELERALLGFLDDARAASERAEAQVGSQG